MAIYAAITYNGNNLVGTQRFGQVLISIFDSATGLPAEGNNCQVTYQQTINGVVTTNTVVVPGINYAVYSGELSDSNPSSLFSSNWVILDIQPPSGGSVDPAADDLVLVAIDTTPESTIGAGDGTVEIIATSSFGPIQYSLDNSTWQNSPMFTAQPGGIGTGYAKDANGGLVSGPYTVGFVGNVLASDPSVDLGNGNVSRWNAAFNPIWFRFQRKDFEITSVVQGASNNIQVAVNADLTLVNPRQTINGITTPGDFVYINTAKYNGTFEVVSKNGSNLVLACTWTANDTLGFININSIKSYYQIQMIITYVDPVTGQFATAQTNFNPNSTGFVEADISVLLQSLLQAKDKSDYTQINYRDAQLSASYTIQYAETWTSAIVSWVTITRPYYVIYAAKQLGQKGGGNLQEYVPYLLGFQPAKWLTDFAMPVYSGGFPFDLAFIFSEYMVGLAPFFNIELLDINMNSLANQSVADGFLLNEDNSFQLAQDGSKFIIASQSLSNVPIVEHVGLNRLLINFDIPDQCYYFKVQIQYTASGTTYNLTQALTCRIDQNTPDRPVYLRWIGLNGSWNYYKFVYNQVVSLDVSNSTTIKRFVVDWENEDTIEDVISKNAGEKMQVFAENVSVDDIKGLQSIKYSPKVQICTNPFPVKWQTVIVATSSSTEYETMIDQYSFGITFSLPEINVQNQ